MKIRSDFVTNSSSSSYLLAYKEEDFDEETLKKYPVLNFHKEVLRQLFGVSELLNGVFEKPEDFLLDMLGENKIEDLSENERKRYDNAMSYVEKGYILAMQDIDYDADQLVDLFSNLRGEYLVILECI